jgi:serine/threonine protein kinase
MPKLSKTIIFETTFGEYGAEELLGEGGAGRVYGGTSPEGEPVAIKVLAHERVSSDKRRRFKNELAFHLSNKHPNIITVIDHGVSVDPAARGPFYVMRKYAGSLRNLIENGIAPDNVLPLFSQMLDGTEAAHLKGVVHRDLKPENILYSPQPTTLAIGDFGIAQFTEELLVTLVETAPTQRLANFVYAAPEQRRRGLETRATTDIYALGLMLNEMVTGTVPHGTNYRLIGQVFGNLSFLDGIVEKMLEQEPSNRPASIADVKQLIMRFQSEAVTMQRLSQIEQTAIKTTDIDDPLAITPPKLVAADWNGGVLTLMLDRPVHQMWINALHQMGSYSSVMGKDPQTFHFEGKKVSITARESEVQLIIDYFKTWLPIATRNLRTQLEQAAIRQTAVNKENLRREKEAEELRLRINRQIKI